MAQDGIMATVTGRWGQTPEVKVINPGRSVAKGRLAVGSRVKVDGVWSNGPTLWLDVQRWDGQLPGVKGDQLEITGQLRHGEYKDAQGNIRQTLTLYAEDAKIVWSRQQPAIANVNLDAPDDDLPF